LLPTDYDPHEAEAEHLVLESDTNGDRLLSKDEALTRFINIIFSPFLSFYFFYFLTSKLLEKYLAILKINNVSIVFGLKKSELKQILKVLTLKKNLLPRIRPVCKV